MRIYVAAPWADRDKAEKFADLLESKPLGHTITHKWWITEEKGSDYALEEDLFRRCAIDDFVAIQTADQVIVLNTQKRGEETSGKAVETGIALALRVPVMVVGGWTNVFHYFPGVKLVDSCMDALEVLKG